MQIEKNKSGAFLSVSLGAALFPQFLFFDDNERTEDIRRNYILSFLRKEPEVKFFSEASPDAESAGYSFANFRPLFEHAMRESGMQEGSKDARTFREAYNAFDTMAVGLEKRVTQGSSLSKEDLVVPLTQFAVAINDMAKRHNAGR